jgi:hypothetical protein
MLPVLYLASVQLFTFTDKLSDYYDGDMVQVLYHGYGQVLESYLAGLTGFHVVLIGILSLPLVMIGLSLFLRGKSREQVYITVSILLTLGMGACGYSTMFTNTPTIVLCGVALAFGPRSPNYQLQRRVSLA